MGLHQDKLTFSFSFLSWLKGSRSALFLGSINMWYDIGVLIDNFCNIVELLLHDFEFIIDKGLHSLKI